MKIGINCLLYYAKAAMWAGVIVLWVALGFSILVYLHGCSGHINCVDDSNICFFHLSRSGKNPYIATGKAWTMSRITKNDKTIEWKMPTRYGHAQCFTVNPDGSKTWWHMTGKGGRVVEVPKDSWFDHDKTKRLIWRWE